MQEVILNTFAGTPALKIALENDVPASQAIMAQHVWLDGIMTQFPGHGTVTCKPGCSHCCKGSEIRINQTEARLLEKTSGMKANLMVKATEKNRQSEVCVFLDQDSNLCHVYEHRPATCRTALSFDVPDKCKTEELRTMVVSLDIYKDLASQVSRQEIDRLYDAMGNEADIREFFPPTLSVM